MFCLQTDLPSAVSQELRQQKEFLEEDRSKLWTADAGEGVGCRL